MLGIDDDASITNNVSTTTTNNVSITTINQCNAKAATINQCNAKAATTNATLKLHQQQQLINATLKLQLIM